jgi:hypothetical protein
MADLIKKQAERDNQGCSSQGLLFWGAKDAMLNAWMILQS